MKHLKIALLSAALVVGLATLYSFFMRTSSAVPDDLLQEIVYVDQKTGEAFLLRARSSPEIHPETGDATLIPGMYCEKCKAWKPVGPMEMLQTQRVIPKCPIHKVVLKKEGPLPDSP